jgi:diacylglycerol kinase (ATP)
VTAGPVALLVNPTAGSGRGGRVAGAVTQALRDAGLPVTGLAGASGAEAADLARQAVQAGARALVALGGDGLVHLALQAVAGTATPLGVLPAGTGNDIAATLGIPARPAIAVARLVRALRAAPAGRAIDAVRVDGQWFAGVLGAGFDSLVNDRANRMRWPRGRLRYDVALLAELRVLRPRAFSLDLDGETVETDAMLVAVGNTRSYGAGMKITPQARVDDGLLDVVWLGPVSRGEFLRAFPRVYRGTHITHPAVSMRRARVVRLDSPGVAAYADGEYLAPLPVRCECVPGAVRVLA